MIDARFAIQPENLSFSFFIFPIIPRYENFSLKTEFSCPSNKFLFGSQVQTISNIQGCSRNRKPTSTGCVKVYKQPCLKNFDHNRRVEVGFGKNRIWIFCLWMSFKWCELDHKHLSNAKLCKILISRPILVGPHEFSLILKSTNRAEIDNYKYIHTCKYIKPKR